MKKIATLDFLRPETSIILPKQKDELNYEHSGIIVVPAIILPKSHKSENQIVCAGGQVLLCG